MSMEMAKKITSYINQCKLHAEMYMLVAYYMTNLANGKSTWSIMKSPNIF